MAREQSVNRQQRTVSRQLITQARLVVTTPRTWDNWSGTLWNALNSGSTTWNQMGSSGSRQQVT